MMLLLWFVQLMTIGCMRSGGSMASSGPIFYSPLLPRGATVVVFSVVGTIWGDFDRALLVKFLYGAMHGGASFYRRFAWQASRSIRCIYSFAAGMGEPRSFYGVVSLRAAYVIAAVVGGGVCRRRRVGFFLGGG